MKTKPIIWTANGENILNAFCGEKWIGSINETAGILTLQNLIEQSQSPITFTTKGVLDAMTIIEVQFNNFIEAISVSDTK